MENKTSMKFIKTSDSETADKLRSFGFTEIAEQNNGTYCFLNDGKKLTFDLEKYNACYTNILCL